MGDADAGTDLLREVVGMRDADADLDTDIDADRELFASRWQHTGRRNVRYASLITFMGEMSFPT